MPATYETAYPQLQSNYTEQALHRLFSPTEAEVKWARRHTRERWNRLGLLTLLKSFQTLGYFPFWQDIPPVITRHISACLGLLFVPEVPPGYDESGTRSRHMNHVRRLLGVEAVGAATLEAMQEAALEAARTKEHLADIINVMVEQLVRQRFELPGFSTFVKEATQARRHFNRQCYRQVAGALSADQQAQIDDLLLAPAADGQRSSWYQLKHEPAKPTSKTIRAYAEHVSWLLRWRADLADAESAARRATAALPATKYRQYYYEAYAANLFEIRRFPPAKRYTYAVTLVEKQAARALDNLAYMFIRHVGKLHQAAEKLLDDYRQAHRERLESLLGYLLDVTRAFQREGTTEERFAAIESAMPADPQGLIDECREHLAFSQNNYLWCLPTAYTYKRALLFACLEPMTLHSSSQDRRFEQALAFVRQQRQSRKEYLPADGLDVSWIPEKWRKLVTGKTTARQSVAEVHRKYFELCVFTELQRQLKSGDTYVEGSQDFDDYRSHLISWTAYVERVKDYEQVRGLPTDPEQFTEHLRAWLIDIARQTDSGFPDNTLVRIEDGELVISPMPTPEADPHYEAMDELLKARMPPVSILDVLTYAEQWLRLSQDFGPLSGFESHLETYPERFVSTLFCYGCNLGPTETARSIPGLNRRHLAWVNGHHVTEERLDQAIVKTINAYNHFQLPRYWGSGESAAADGTKWDVYEQNLLSAYHIRYGSYGGIAYYHVSDTYIALFSHFIPCGVYEAVYILDGLLKNQSEIQPKRIHGDTHAQNFAVFGLAYLLGIELMPRIRRHKDLTLFRPDRSTRFAHIDEVFGETINWKLIQTHLPDMLRVVLSIQAGKSTPATLLRRLGTYSRKNKLYYAFRELGRAVRTGFLLRYYHDADLRKTIHAVTNKSEEFHHFAKWTAFANHGVIRTNLRHEQTKIIKYNHLVANALILYNTREMTRVIQELITEGYPVNEQTIRLLGPYRTEHVNRFGSYTLNMDREIPPLEIKFELPV